MRALRVPAALWVLIAPAIGWGSDHREAPVAAQDAAADLSDVYIWMNVDAGTVYLVLDVHPTAPSVPTVQFSPEVLYALHVRSQPSFGEPVAGEEKSIICGFDDAIDQTAQCWLGQDEFVEGIANDPEGIANDEGTFRVFAGPRSDPFFFNEEGFEHSVEEYLAWLDQGDRTFDAAGSPDLDETTAFLLERHLSHNGFEDPANTFDGFNVLSIVVEVATELVTGGGPAVGVWASTHWRAE